MFLGHATVAIEVAGMRLITDPVLRQQVGPLWRRTPRPHLGPLAGLDVVLISHLHLDHYDPASLLDPGESLDLEEELAFVGGPLAATPRQEAT